VSNERRLTRLAYACLLIVGINGGWIGPFLPEISSTLHVSIDHAGLVISATAAGYFAALIIAGALSHRWSAQHILIVAMILFTAGLLGLAVASGLPMLLGAGATVGLGNGAIDVAANALIVDLNRERLAAALNYLHVLFGVGALMGPIIVAFALARAIPYWWIFGPGALGCAMVAGALSISGAVEVRVPPEAGGFLPLLSRPIIWVIGAMLFLYVGGEAGVGAWLFLYLRAVAGLGPSVAASGVGVYWMGLVAGRVAGGRLANRIAPRELTIVASAVSVAGFIGLLAASRSYGFAAAMVFAIGFGYGPVFPNMVAIGAARFPAQVGRMSSIVIAGGALGGVFVPWLMGYAMAVSTARMSMELAFGVTTIMLLLSFAVRPHEAQNV
jgi:fucose permease